MMYLINRLLQAAGTRGHGPIAQSVYSRRAGARAVASCLLAALTAWLPGTAAADDWPNGGPICIVVPFPPGGNADLISRVYAQSISKSLGQSIIVENKPGAGGAVGLAFAAKARPDGYTIALSDVGTQVTNVLAIPGLPYDPTKDFVPISRLTSVSLLLVANPKFDFADAKALISYARKHPGKLTFASAGGATPSRFAMELFRAWAGIDMLNVPYKGSGPALVDLIGGQVDTMFDGGATPMVKAGKLKLLAVTGDRNPAFPETPTLREQGLGDAYFTSWHGFFAPSGTPAPIVDRLAKEIELAGKRGEVRDALSAIGIAVNTQHGPDFERFIADQARSLGQLVRQRQIKFD